MTWVDINPHVTIDALVAARAALVCQRDWENAAEVDDLIHAARTARQDEIVALAAAELEQRQGRLRVV